jgi:hypothetical protein
MRYPPSGNTDAAIPVADSEMVAASARGDTNNAKAPTNKVRIIKC